MSESCDHNCGSCGADCGERTSLEDFREPLNVHSKVKHVIGVVSGKGGVGKSLVTSTLATSMRKKGYKVAILDADITGPSIPRAFGVTEKAKGDEQFIYPVETEDGIKVMSINLLLEDDSAPVIWRGPVIAGAVKQFWTDVVWGDIDYMFVDMPPGTGDVPLTVFQSLPINGIVMVTSPQELVGMIVGKAVKMAEDMRIPVLGLIENMSYYECPTCKDKHEIFGKSHIEEFAKEYNIQNVTKIPIQPQLAELCDQGEIFKYEGNFLNPMVEAIQKAVEI